MLVLVTVLLLVVIGGTLSLVAVLRQARDEVGPTIDAFAEFRGALDPAVLSLRRDALTATRRLGQGRFTGQTNSPSIGR